MSIKSSDPVAPSQEVLDAFGLNEDLEPVSGGRGLCFRVGDFILKPADDEEETQWVSETVVKLLDRHPSRYRLARPLPVVSNSTQYIFQGWAASSFLNGASAFRLPFAEIFDVSRAFCADLAALGHVEPPACLKKRMDRWAEADRVTWNEKALDDVENVNAEMLQLMGQTLAPLRAIMKPLPRGLAHQLIHADITVNILFDNQGSSPPGIIDITLCWRPAPYAEAIAVADGLTWRGEGKALIELYGVDEVRLQLLVRAMYWRNISFAIDSDMQWIRGNIDKADFHGALQCLQDFVDT